VRVRHSIPAALGVTALVAVAALAIPPKVEAQHLGGARGRSVRSIGVRSVVGQRSRGPSRGYRQYRSPIRGDASGAVRIEVMPREADVYVDGYLAGRVDDFDGIFQRLYLPRGGHEITIYMSGYRSIQQNVFVGPASKLIIKQAMVPLAPGEFQEPQPQPQPLPPPESGRGGRTPAPPTVGAPDARFGSLAILVRPSDADIIVDGEPWSTPQGQDRLVVRLGEGRHHVEVRKEGFSTYVEDVLIRRGATMNLNVSLIKDAL
jgi:PEGA domain